MIGLLVVVGERGLKATVDVQVTAKGVNKFEISAQIERIKRHLGLSNESDHSAYIQIPSKMNLPGFVIDDDEGPF